MSKLPYLVREINNGVEVFFSGRGSGAYLRTAFILCDDFTELCTKAFLGSVHSGWSDKKTGRPRKACPMNPPIPHCPLAKAAPAPAPGGFKNFVDVVSEVVDWFARHRAAEHATVEVITKRMQERRDRRNEFFHSTHLLDLNLHDQDCVRAFIDLLDYGKLLFPAEWDLEVAAAANLESYDALLRVIAKGHGDPVLIAKLNDLLGNWPAMTTKVRKKGAEVAQHAEDLHLRLCIRNGGNLLRDKLRALL